MSHKIWESVVRSLMELSETSTRTREGGNIRGHKKPDFAENSEITASEQESEVEEC